MRREKLVAFTNSHRDIEGMKGNRYYKNWQNAVEK